MTGLGVVTGCLIRHLTCLLFLFFFCLRASTCPTNTTPDGLATHINLLPMLSFAVVLLKLDPFRFVNFNNVFFNVLEFHAHNKYTCIVLKVNRYDIIYMASTSSYEQTSSKKEVR